MNSYSQASQDLFYMKTLKYKNNGYFLEIGSNNPIIHNNTYLAESKYGWKGIMVEYHRSVEQSYKIHRPNSIHVLEDATKVDYRNIFESNNFPVNMDYLQIDLEVNNRSTLTCLELLNNTIFDKYTFATVTFEHDIYTGDHFDTRNKSRKIFSDRGYKLVYPDVSCEGRSKPFEDWYIHPSIVKEFKYSDKSLYHKHIIKQIDN